jgi:hypothetical protein
MIIRVITMVLKKIKDMNLIYNHRSQKIIKNQIPGQKTATSLQALSGNLQVL